MGSNGNDKGEDDPKRDGEPSAREAEAAAEDHGPPPEQRDAPGEPAPEGVETPDGAAWARPFYALDVKWTWLESRLLVVVLFAELAALAAWVLLNDLTDDKSFDGALFRALLGAIAVGLAAWFASKSRSRSSRTWIAIAGIVVGGFLGLLCRSIGVAYLDNLKGWLQEGSTLTLMGGLRGVATRLTLWLALLGGSMATGAGRHIHVDLIYRLLPKRLRLAASLTNTCFAAIVCFAAVWGFLDHIAINSFAAQADEAPGKKIGGMTHVIADHLFLARKQVGLDVRTLPKVLVGERYDRWMSGRAWNAWVDDGGFDEHWSKERVDSIKVGEETETHTPLVISPDGTATRGMLVQVLGLVFPFGLLAIGLRFVLRAILTLSGHYKTDPEEAHKEDFGTKVEEKV